MKLDRQLGFLVLGVWLVVYGLSQVVNLHFQGFPIVMGVGEIAAGALIVLKR